MTDAGDMLTPGTRLGELEIERVLGAGGFGVTYLARDLSLDVRRAVKEYLPRDWGTRLGDGTIGPRTGSDAEDYRWGLERFLKEARILAQFDHPNLVRVQRVFEAWGTAYMVMEYVEGRTLKKEVEASGPLPEARVREVLAALTEGLEAVHGADLLHRDIKPENVMVRPDGTLVLIDFGSARQAIGGHSRSLTAVLTPGYAPIEQYSGRGHQGPWTDIYALGAVAYWALSGEAPEEATERVRGDRLLPVAQAARVRVSARLAAAVDAALTVNEAERPQSLQEWRGMLERGAMKPPPAGEEEPPAAPPRGAARVVLPETAEERSGQGTAGRRKRLGVVAAAGLAVAALVVALTVTWNGSDPVPIPVVTDTPIVIDPDPDPEPSPAAVDPVAVEPAPSEPDADVSPDLPVERAEIDPDPVPSPVVSPADPMRDLAIQRFSLDRDRTQTMALWTIQLANRSRQHGYKDIQYATNYYNAEEALIYQNEGIIAEQLNPGDQRTISEINDGLYPVGAVRYTIELKGAEAVAEADPVPSPVVSPADPMRDLAIQRFSLDRDRTQTMALWTIQLANRSRQHGYKDIQYATNYYNAEEALIYQNEGIIAEQLNPGDQRTISEINDGLYPVGAVRYTIELKGAEAVAEAE